MRILQALVCVALLASCSSSPLNVARQPSSEKVTELTPELTILFASHRHGILEPCGCTIRPLGGLVREANAVNLVRSSRPHLIQLSGGITFPSFDVTLDKNVLDFVKDRSALLVKAMNLLGVDVLSPSADDFKLSTEALQTLQRQSKFVWVSSDLFFKKTGKPVFAQQHTLEKNGKKVVVLGLSATKTAPKKVGIEVRSADSVLPNLLQGVAPEAVVVLIAPLSIKERESIAKKYPRINIVLGGSNTEPETGGVWLRNQSALYSAEKQARRLGVIDVGGTFPIKRVYSSSTALSLYNDRSSWLTQLENKKLSPALRKKLEQKVKETELVPLQYEPGMTWFSSETLTLNGEFDGPNPEMEGLLSSFKKQLRDRALQTVESPE